MTLISYAQNFEDVLLWRAFGTVRDGFYIDVGAAHPDIDSVTRSFYDRGWTGINIEPVPEYFARLQAARPRDINLRLAVAANGGSGTVYVVAGTGLSTIDATLAARHRDDSFDVREQHVPITTLADICREHAPPDIHFLKIDVEGAELAVLQGADFAIFRPRIVLVEATAPGTTLETHDEWESILLEADYSFLWFDGLNRFYAANEHWAALAPHFRVPVCVFDDFLRAADTEWTRRITTAEAQIVHARSQAADLLEQAMVFEAAAETAGSRARDADTRAREAEQRARNFAVDAANATQRSQTFEARAAAAEHLVQHGETQTLLELARLKAMVTQLQAEEAALRASTSWKLTAPLRTAMETTRGLARRGRTPGPPPAQLPTASAAQPTENPATVAHSARRAAPGVRAHVSPLHIVHQFHSGSAVNDAITNALFLIRTRLRAMGYTSDIFVEHCDPLLADELRPAEDLPVHDGYVLILHHSMGFDAYDRIVALPATKILMYHNITPPEMFADQPHIQHYARLGREQLAGLRNHVVSALADSEYNAIELRALGFADVAACTVLFDLDVLRSRVRRSGEIRADGTPFTILFVGRIIASKGQLDLVEAYAAFRRRYHLPSRLVLVGRSDGPGQSYREEIEARVSQLGLAPFVSLTGMISGAELDVLLGKADLYVSLSRHEGFGVPLVEASAAGIPVLAWPAGAVPYTLGVNGGLLDTREPNGVAERLAALADDVVLRTDLAMSQRAALDCYALPEQLERLRYTLVRAGAATPRDALAAALLAGNARYTVAGHVNKTYSLAAINRSMARTLDHARPGRVRLQAVEGEPTGSLADVPAAELASTAALVARPPHETGPVVVISQHYPVYVPEDRGDVLLAMVFWEESLLPATTAALLNGSFDAVLAPSRFVAKALVDSGVCVPVHMVGYAPALDGYRDVAPRHSPAGPFTFLHVSSAFPRKGLDVLLAAYRHSFRDTDAVRLVVKTFPNPHNDAALQIQKLRDADPHAAAIELIDHDVADDEMVALYTSADAVVLPTRGEGFNLPAAEAMAAGVPLIVTDAGGHMDFCDEDTARLVRSSPALSHSHVATPSSFWAEPDVDDLSAALREALDDPAASLARAGRARAAIVHRLDPSRFVQAIETAAVAVLLHRPAATLRVCVVTSWEVRCGVAGYTRFLLDAMRAADPGLELTILSDTRPPESSRGDMPVQQVWTLGSPDNAASLLRAIARQDPDVVMIQHQPGLLDWATLARLVQKTGDRPVVVTLHTTAHLLEIDAELRETVVESLRTVARVIVHSLADIRRLGELGLSGNVVHVPHGAPEMLPAASVRPLTATQAVTIGCYGFLLPDKGIPALVEAVSLLRARWPKARLILCNALYGNPLSDEEAKHVRRTIEQTGLESAVELVTDYLSFEDARSRLAGCDIIALPYPQSKEAASGALHMALGAGRCVAVTPIALFDEAGDAVFRLAGHRPADIAAGLSDLLASRDLRETIGNHARVWMAARQWSVVAIRVSGMLRGLRSIDPQEKRRS